VSGLGLSQVYGFCLQAGGRARLDSVRGQGTSVTLVLPAHTPATDELNIDAPPTPSIAHARVLLVEDNDALREATAALLSSYGCEVVACAGARAAMKLIDTAPGFDVVLTDVLMPGDMDGIALANHLRQILPQLPVVLITGHPGEARPPPGFHLIRKPCTPETLVHAIEQAMAHQPP
jgi:CheY-like chemotaxis protein